MLKDKIDSLLDLVQKPARYMGGEMNAVLKDPDAVAIRYAFAFPDVYEVGMSHLGSRILYDIINKREDALCERVFMPWVDMADLMRKEQVPLFSLETRSPVRGFDYLYSPCHAAPSAIFKHYQLCSGNPRLYQRHSGLASHSLGG